jgi:GT2 family glycosyltransferase
MMPDISVLLPTVRPDQFRRSFDSIAAAAGAVSYEVVIVADFPQPEDVDCCWIVRERRGVVDAVTRACEFARGRYLFLFNDESTLDPEALERLYHEAEACPGSLLTPQHVPAYTFEYFGRAFAAFPFAHRDVLAHVGGLLDPVFKSFYADPDLGMRAHAASVPIRTVEGAIIRHNNGSDAVKAQNVAQYMASDQDTFRMRWKHLGIFRDC